MRRIATTLIVLLCVGGAVHAEDKSPAEQMKEIRAEWSKAQADFLKEYQAAKTPEDRQKAFQNQPKPAKYTERALELATKNTKDPEVALDALTFIVTTDRGPTKKDSTRAKALAALTSGYADNDKLKVAILLGLGSDTSAEAGELLKAVVAKNKATELQGVATYVQGQVLREQGEMLERLKEYPEYAKFMETQLGKEEFEKLSKLKPADLDKQAEKLFEIVVEKYKDVEIPWGRNKAKIATKAAGQLFQIRNLAVGKTVPDETVELLDGKKVKFSELRGKVVVLDIWATWCGPCRAMIPHEREMVKKLSDKPFVLMSISADAEKETLEKFLEKNEMPWKHVHNGAQGGLVEKWNVSYFPTIYVIDAKGVIRYKDIREKKMEDAVEKLLEEAAEASKKSS